MSITIKSEDKDGYLQISCQGVYETDSFISVFKNALLLTEERSYKYLLLDVREITGNPPSTFDRYEIGSQVADIQRSLNTYSRIAVVGNEPMIDPQRFGEIVALNRGVQGKVFTDLDQAIVWIKKTKGDIP